MDDALSGDTTRVRFTADRLPVTKLPLIVVENADGGDQTGPDTLVLPLRDDVTLREAKRLAGRLNARTARVGARPRVPAT